MLGPEHAREHAELRREARAAARRRAKPPPSQRHERAKARASARAAGPRDQVGAWTQAPFDLPNYAIHAAMLPTGKVLFYGYFFGAYEPGYPGRAALWDPSAGTGPGSFTIVDPPEVDLDGDGESEPAPIFCSACRLSPMGPFWWRAGGSPRGSRRPRARPRVHVRSLAGDLDRAAVDKEAGRTIPPRWSWRTGGRRVRGLVRPGAGRDRQPATRGLHAGRRGPGRQGTIQRFPSGDRVTSVYPLCSRSRTGTSSSLARTSRTRRYSRPRTSPGPSCRSSRASEGRARRYCVPRARRAHGLSPRSAVTTAPMRTAAGTYQSVASSETIDAGDPASGIRTPR